MHAFFLYMLHFQNLPFIQYILFGDNLALTNSSNIACKVFSHLFQSPALLESIARVLSKLQPFLNSVPLQQPMALSQYILYGTAGPVASHLPHFCSPVEL